MPSFRARPLRLNGVRCMLRKYGPASTLAGGPDAYGQHPQTGRAARRSYAPSTATGCVRYRYDLQRRRRLKTVELIVDETDWEPRPEVQVFVRIAYAEEQARRRVKRHGARWHPERRLWSLPYGTAKRLQLEHRIVEEPRGVYTGGDG